MERADSAVFSVLFMAIGTMLLMNQPPDQAGFVIVSASVAYGAAAVFAFRAIVAKR